MKKTRAEIIKAFNRFQKTGDKNLRFGQWYIIQLDSMEVCPEIFYQPNDRKALNDLVNDPRFCSDAEQQQF